MPTSYFSADKIDKYPFQINQIIRTVVVWLANEVLYKDENYQTEAEAFSRFFITNVNADMGGREVIKRVKNNSWEFPFTIYAPGDSVPNDAQYNEYGQGGLYYSSATGGYVLGRPMKFDLLFASFFNTQKDYFTAYKIVSKPLWTLNRLYVPITINGVLTQFPITLNTELTKGEYAQEFKEWLAKGKILDLVHTISMEFYDYAFPDEDGSAVKPVDDVIIALKTIKNAEITSLTSQNKLQVNGFSPADDTEDVAIYEPVEVSFTHSMQEETAENSFSIFPHVNGNFAWNDSGTIMTYTPSCGYASGTVYSCAVDMHVAKDVYNGKLLENTEWNFTTV